MRRDFIANLSHELRTPLTALLGFIETLRGPARDDDAARDRFLAIMQREAGRMARLVDELLSLSRVEARRTRPPDPTCRARTLIESAIASLAPTAAASGVELVAALPPAEVTVPGDANQLRQVVLNLVENAIKYEAATGTVDIALSSPEPEPSLRTHGVRLTVTDHAKASQPSYPAPDRTLLPGRQPPLARNRRHRARPCHRQAYRRSPPRPSSHCEHAGEGKHVQRHPSGRLTPSTA